MVEGDSKKTERAKRGTNDGMDEEPIEEGFFDSSLISDPLLVCVFGFLGLYSFGSARKELDLIRPDLTTGQTQTRIDFSRSLSNRKINLLNNHKFPTLSLSPHSILEFPFSPYTHSL